jgi:hypothetical protein
MDSNIVDERAMAILKISVSSFRFQVSGFRFQVSG